MVLAVIVFCLKVHLTAEVTALIKMGIPDIGLAIVYRTIQLLNELHLIDRVNFDDGFVGCGIGNTTEQKQRIHHHHLTCMKCGKAISFQEELSEGLKVQIADSAGFYCSVFLALKYSLSL